MKVFKYLQVALESIVAHKMRAILTMLGIIIGVAAVLSTMGIGRGAAASITERIESQGTNLLTVNPGAGSSGGGLGGESGSAGTLTIGDARALMDGSPSGHCHRCSGVWRQRPAGLRQYQYRIQSPASPRYMLRCATWNWLPAVF